MGIVRKIGGRVCKIRGHKWYKAPDGGEGCCCERCGKPSSRWPEGHDYGPWEPYDQFDHKRTCTRCGFNERERHTFEVTEGCFVRCSECGFELEWHYWSDGVCARCGIDESGYYRDLVLSGSVRLDGREEVPCEGARRPDNPVGKYWEHLRRAYDLAEVVARYKPCGTPISELEDERAALECVRKLGQIARGEGEEAAEANRALYDIALSGPDYCKDEASIWVCDPELASDPRIEKAARRERSRQERLRETLSGDYWYEYDIKSGM